MQTRRGGKGLGKKGQMLTKAFFMLYLPPGAPVSSFAGADTVPLAGL